MARSAAGEHAGARVSDLDLAILTAEPERYLSSVDAQRAELADELDGDWREARLARLAKLLAAEPLFHVHRPSPVAHQGPGRSGRGTAGAPRPYPLTAPAVRPETM